MDVYAIVNPVSGARRVESRLAELVTRLSEHDCALHVLSTQAAHDATRLAASVPSEARAVIAVGGDGTCREVAEGLIGRDIPMCVWPRGTENIVAQYYGYKNQIAALTDTIIHGRRASCDIGTLNDRKFMIVVGVGFDAYAAAVLASRRSGHITYLDWFAAIGRALRHYRFPPVTATVDEEIIFEGSGIVFVGVLRRYAMKLPLLLHAQHDDGRLHVCVMPCHSRRALVGHAWRAFTRRHLQKRGVIYRTCQQARITAAGDGPVPIQMDGDAAGLLPVECGILPGALQLLLPAGSPLHRDRS